MKKIDIAIGEDRMSVSIAIEDDSGSKSVRLGADGLQSLIRHLIDIEASLSRRLAGGDPGTPALRRVLLREDG